MDALCTCTDAEEAAVQVERVGVIGLGRIGRCLTAQLVDLGVPVSVYDPQPRRVTAAVMRGATAALLPADAAESADVVIVAVDDEKTAEEVLFDHGGIGETLRSGGLVVDASRTDAAFSARATARLARFGITRMDVGGSLVRLRPPLYDVAADPRRITASS
jgi:3-hydroxyisobutyrate dehydrogenase-like beta-hydroxyacid dehydrogenase